MREKKHCFGVEMDILVFISEIYLLEAWGGQEVKKESSNNIIQHRRATWKQRQKIRFFCG